jgi:hypothetical protein
MAALSRCACPSPASARRTCRAGRLEPGRLLSLAIVAIGREFDAELFVQSVGFYR